MSVRSDRNDLSTFVSTVMGLVLVYTGIECIMMIVTSAVALGVTLWFLRWLRVIAAGWGL